VNPSTVCSLLLLSLALLARADDPPAVQKPGPQNGKATPPDKVAPAVLVQIPVMEDDSPVGTGFTEIVEAANKELAKGKTPEQVGKVFAETAEKMVAHARKHPTDASSLTGLVQAIGLLSDMGGSEKARAEAIDLIKKHFAKTKAIRPHLMHLAGGLDPAGADLVRSVFKDHPDPLTRAQAAKALISGQSERERVAEAFAKNDETDIVTKFEKKRLGEDGVKRFLDSVANEKKAVEEYRAALRNELKGLLPERGDPKDLEPGKPAPETVWVDLDGKKVKLSDLNGRVVVLDFWHTRCPPCRKMIPHSRDLVKRLNGKPFVFVSVSVDREKELLTKFLAKESMPWTHCWDGENKVVSELWNVDGYPTLYVIDHTGVIRNRTMGYDPDASKNLDALIEVLVKAAESAKK
jgi:thiol-disulfide isomerase/thioredoxin